MKTEIVARRDVAGQVVVGRNIRENVPEGAHFQHDRFQVLELHCARRCVAWAQKHIPIVNLWVRKL